MGCMRLCRTFHITQGVGGLKHDKDTVCTVERVYCIKHVRLVGVLLYEWVVWQTGVCCYIMA